MKIKHVQTGDGGHYGYRFECPGCGDGHVIPTKPHEKGWDFDGNEAAPTFSPSILVHPHGVLNDDGTVSQTPRCHSFVRAGRIEFCSDSTHALAGQTVELPDIPHVRAIDFHEQRERDADFPDSAKAIPKEGK